MSGRTDYPERSLVVRTLALLERGFLDTGDAGPTWSVSYNNAAYQRSLLVAQPFPDLDFACGGKPLLRVMAVSLAPFNVP